MISHLYLITLLEKDNQMGSEQLSIIFGTNLFGIENWLERDQLESTQESDSKCWFYRTLADSWQSTAEVRSKEDGPESGSSLTELNGHSRQCGRLMENDSERWLGKYERP